jgi:hypothetical protein
LKNKIAVIGVGNARYSNVLHIDDYGLAAQAFSNALADLGIDGPTFEGFSSAASRIARGWAKSLGSTPRRTMTLLGHCHMSGMGFIAASVVIAAGHVEYAAPNALSAVRVRSIVAATAATLSWARR